MRFTFLHFRLYSNLIEISMSHLIHVFPKPSTCIQIQNPYFHTQKNDMHTVLQKHLITFIYICLAFPSDLHGSQRPS